LLRIGQPGRLALIGASLSAERATPAEAAVVGTDSGLVEDTSGVLNGIYQAYRANRINLLLAYRQVNFMRVTGFDALTGAQDVRRGVQVGATIGRGLAVGGAPPDELYAAVNVYAGGGTRTSFAAIELSGEGRRENPGAEWDGLLVAGRLAWYARPHSRHTVITSVEYGAGRRQRMPFQLTLGDRRGGLRGYEREEQGGAERLVARVEERWRVGSIRGNADAGLAFFTDVGWLRAGDAPLGVNSGVKPAVGIGLLGALPPGSRRLWRVDVAIPLRPEAGARWGVRVTSEDRTRAFFIEPNDIRRNHERTVPASVFTWP
jgi:hypothetical protein